MEMYGVRPLPRGVMCLVAAILRGDAGDVHLCLERVTDLNQESPWGVTPLGAAVRCGNVDFVRHLIARGASVDKLSFVNPRRTPLMEAVEQGDLSMAQLLLAHGASCSQVNEYGVSALMLAAENGHVSMVALLTDYGACDLYGLALCDQYDETVLFKSMYADSSHCGYLLFDQVYALLSTASTPGVRCVIFDTVYDVVLQCQRMYFCEQNVRWLCDQLIRLAYWYGDFSRRLSPGLHAFAVGTWSFWRYGLRVCICPVFGALESWRCLGISSVSGLRVSRLQFVFICKRIRIITDWPDCYLRLVEMLRLCVRATSGVLRVFSHRTRRTLVEYVLPATTLTCVERVLSDGSLPIRSIVLSASKACCVHVLRRAHSDPGGYMRLSDR